MLKKICRLFLGLIVFMGSACVTPTHASSANSIILTYIQASGEAGAKDELIVLHNNSSVEVEVTNWCVRNKYALFACFVSDRSDVIEQYYIPPYGDVTVASEEYVEASGLPYEAFTFVYQITNQSSGSIVNGSDVVSLLDTENQIVDTKTWTSAIPTGKVLARIKVVSGPDIYATGNETSDWGVESRVLPPESNLEIRETLIEFPEEPEDPDDTESPETPGDSSGETPQATSLLPPIITEVFANPAGVDTGNEFIELYNPNEEVVSLDAFTLHVGVSSVKTYGFPVGLSIPPHGYVAFSNQEIAFTLVNTTGRVQLSSEGELVGAPVDYTAPKDDYAWALIEGVWQYTKNRTPGGMNQLEVQVSEEDDNELSSTDTRKPCATNQYRNPATGRCKLLVAATSTRTPCKVGQIRNPETNRCRSTAVAANTPAPCKEGQERNPETNRCRNIVKMTNADHAVLGVQTKADAAMQWYYWATITLVVVLILVYGVWEWRQELLAVWSRLKARFARGSD